MCFAGCCHTRSKKISSVCDLMYYWHGCWYIKDVQTVIVMYRWLRRYIAMIIIWRWLPYKDAQWRHIVAWSWVNFGSVNGLLPDQAISWTNDGILLVRFWLIPMRAISQRIPKLVLCTMGVWVGESWLCYIPMDLVRVARTSYPIRKSAGCACDENAGNVLHATAG